ncbi:hypothetical protein BHM03_00001972, partial [Ensete ventricosum]
SLQLRHLFDCCMFVITELRIGHEDNSYVYNHTLARILVEYASAVSSFNNTSLMRNIAI